jgi:hypothetical protein
MTHDERSARQRELRDLEEAEKQFQRLCRMMDRNKRPRVKPGRRLSQREAARRETFHVAPPMVSLTTRQKRRLLAEVEYSPLAWELRELVRERAPHVSSLGRSKITHYAPTGEVTQWRELECWCSSATVLLHKLNTRAAPANQNSAEWPQTPQQLGRMLNQLAPSLALKDVRLSYTRHGVFGRLWTLSMVDGDVTLISQAARTPGPAPG